MVTETKKSKKPTIKQRDFDDEMVTFQEGSYKFTQKIPNWVVQNLHCTQASKVITTLGTLVVIAFKVKAIEIQNMNERKLQKKLKF